MNSQSIDANAATRPERLTLHIPGMDCPDEFRLIRQGLSGHDGIFSLLPNYLDRTIRVDFDSTMTDPDSIQQHFSKIGFPAINASNTSARASQERGRATTWRSACVMAGACLLLLAGALFVTNRAPQLRVFAAILSAISAGAPVAVAAWRSLRLRRLDMNVLMIIAALGALAIGEWFEAATAMTLFGVAHWLESLSLKRAGQAIADLADRLPQTAHLVSRANRGTACGHDHGNACTHESNSDTPDSGDQPAEHSGTSAAQDVPIGSLQIGDIVAVKPGEPIPIDGQVISGTSAITEAALTGESVPVTRSPSDRVLAGTVNGEGVLHVRAIASAANSAVSQVGRMVDEAQSNRSNAERFVDRFARYYTPVVIALALIVALLVPLLVSQMSSGEVSFIDWFHRGLVLLVIACPCALVISTPVTMVCGLQRATRAGLLVKGANALERAASIDAMAFDKTGTLTVGRPTVVRVAACAGTEDSSSLRNRILQLAAAVEATSAHPIARAIVAAADQDNNLLADASSELKHAVAEATAVPGRGISAKVDGNPIRVGSFEFAVEHLGAAARSAADALLVDVDNVATCVYVAADQLLGRIELTDQLRDDAKLAIDSLRSLGVQRTLMLTGDRQAVAASVASKLNVDESHAQLMPGSKVDRIQQVKDAGAVIAMVGDGFNDAPALATADLGIAMGSGASGLAVESADVVVLSPQLMSLPKLLRLAKRTRQRLWLNIGIALAIKAVVLLLTACGYGTMWLAVAADVGASMLVIFSGMRLLSVRLED